MGVDTWDAAPVSTDGAAWKAEPTGAGAAWEPDGAGDGDDGFTGEFAEANISKHANGDAPADGGCRVCGQDGHFARDCPDKPANSGECFNCGETGHNKAECPNPRVEREFTGNCNICAQTGHRAADCPDKGPTVCKLCKNEGHMMADCSANRMLVNLANLGIEDKSVEEAWAAVELADKEKDVDDIKKAVLTYAKACPAVTFEELEGVFRDADMNTYLIAKQQEVSDTHTIVNLQGKIDKQYVVSFQFTAKPRRAKFAEGWPETPEENVTRLAEAGLIMDRMVQKCSNCGELGHGSRQCEQEKVEPEKLLISCANCNEEGHRARDCTQARKTPGSRACKNCGQEGHIAKECPEPRSAEGVECKNCGEMGHFSRDCPSREPDLCRNCGEEGHRAKECEKERVIKCRNCDGEGHTARECPEPKDMSRVQCRNCDEMGHTSRDCKKPTDWSRVECTNCHEKGHSYKRCPKPAGGDDADAGGDGGWEGNSGAAAGGSGGGGDWGAAEAPAAASGGGW